MSDDLETTLSPDHCEVILALGSRGPGGSFAPGTLSELISFGIIDVTTSDRSMVLTNRGWAVFEYLNRS